MRFKKVQEKLKQQEELINTYKENYERVERMIYKLCCDANSSYADSFTEEKRFDKYYFLGRKLAFNQCLEILMDNEVKDENKKTT